MVSVICLCYNQAKFVKEALNSVVNQSYKAVELIVVDDGSSDDSKAIILEWLANHEEIPFVNLKENLGNTSAFNQGLKLAKGKYVIDLAADDILVANRIERQVDFFERLDSKVGVIYSDANYIDPEGGALYRHFSKTRLHPYEGEVYQKLIDTYFIPPPTMMIKKEVLDGLGGYDESLAYEDFDFWVRSARNWKYAYQSEVLTKVRLIEGSHSDNYYGKGDLKLASTVIVCRKIAAMNQTEEEDIALIRRLKYEIRHSFLAGKKSEMNDFFGLWASENTIPYNYLMIKCIGQLGLNFNWLKKLLKRVLK